MNALRTYGTKEQYHEEIARLKEQIKHEPPDFPASGMLKQRLAQMERELREMPDEILILVIHQVIEREVEVQASFNPKASDVNFQFIPVNNQTVMACSAASALMGDEKSADEVKSLITLAKAGDAGATKELSYLYHAAKNPPIIASFRSNL